MSESYVYSVMAVAWYISAFCLEFNIFFLGPFSVEVLQTANCLDLGQQGAQDTWIMHGVCSQAYSPVCAATLHMQCQRRRLSYGDHRTAEDKTERREEGGRQRNIGDNTRHGDVQYVWQEKNKTRNIKGQFTQITKKIFLMCHCSLGLFSLSIKCSILPHSHLN